MRFALLVLSLVLMPVAAFAVETPAGQEHVGADKIVRGTFNEQHQLQGVAQPMLTSGTFVVAPAKGLIWEMQMPMQTTTIIMADKAVQDFGGLPMKLSAKNLKHLYDMVGHALAGDWSGLEEDFVIRPSGGAGHWQMVLTPKPEAKAAKHYSAITVNGGKFLDKIVMTDVDGTSDTIMFSDVVMSPAVLTPKEQAFFTEAAM